MRRKKYIPLILSMVMLLLSSCLFSCIRSDYDASVDDGSSQVVDISFTIRVSDGTTRAEVSEEEGTGRENYIDVANGDYRFLIFDTDDKYVTTFTPTSLVPCDDSEYPVEWHVSGSFEAADLDTYTSFKLVVLANWGSGAYPTDLTKGTTTIEDVCTASTSVYSYSTDYTANFLAGNELIPMYGVAAFEGNSFTAGWETNVGTVYMIRAMARVEMIVESTDTLLMFSSVKVNRYNSKGYCAPGDILSDADYDNGWAVHLVDDANDTDSKKVDFVMTSQWTEDEAIYEKWITYIPEYMNVGAGDNYSSVEVKFNIQLDGDDPHTIYFAEYTDGVADNTDRLDILRDYIYRFYVKCTGYNYTLLLTVSDWEGLYENSFDFGDGQVVSPISPWDDETSNEVEF